MAELELALFPSRRAPAPWRPLLRRTSAAAAHRSLRWVLPGGHAGALTPPAKRAGYVVIRGSFEMCHRVGAGLPRALNGGGSWRQSGGEG